MVKTETETDDSDSWIEDARELHEKGGVPKRQSQCVALYASGRTYQQIADELGMSSRGNVGVHIRAYRDFLSRSEWLAEHGPEF